MYVFSPRFSILLGFLLLAILTGITRPVVAQIASVAFSRFSLNEGLPSNECYEIIQDRKGYVWVSHDNGISRFDGYDFKNYGSEEGLLDKTVLNMREDHRGWIWLGTFSGNFYILRGDTIAPYPHNHLLQRYREKYYAVRSFVVDTLGTLHVSLSTFAIMSIEVDGTHRIHGPEHPAMNGVFQAGGTHLLFTEIRPNVTKEKAEKNSLLKTRDTIRVDVFTPAGISDSYFFHFPELVNRRSSATDPGVDLHHISKDIFLLQNYKRLTLFTPDTVFIANPPFWNINQLNVLPNGQIVAGYNSRGGIRIFERLEDLLNDGEHIHLFDGYTVSHSLYDLHGGLWLTTIEDGVIYLPRLDVPVLRYNTENNISKRIAQFTPIGRDNALIQYENNVFEVLKPKTRKPFTPPPVDRRITQTYYEEDNDLLVLYPFFSYLANDKWLSIDYRRPQRISSNDLRINEFRKDRYQDDYYWAAEYFEKAALLRLHRQDGIFTVDTAYYLQDKGRIHTYCQLNPESYAIGDMQGLYLYNTETNTISTTSALEKVRGRINHLVLYQDNYLIAATHNRGIALIDLARDSVRFITTREGLFTNTVSNLFIDRQQNVWADSRTGLNKLMLSEDSTVVTSYSSATGLPANDIEDLDQWGDYVAVTTSKGIALISLDSTAKVAEEVPFFYEVFQGDHRITEPAGLELPYDRNSLRFIFYYLDYRYQGKYTYRYRLTQDASWTTTSSRELVFTNLPADRYRLEVEIKIPGKVWGKGQIIEFRILPPLWQTWWFILGGVLILSAVLGYIIMAYLKNVRQENRSVFLEKEIDRLKQQAYRAQMNPHFIFNCLNTLQGLIIGGKTERNTAVRMVNNFSSLIRSALEASEQSVVTLREEIDLIRNYLLLEQVRFDHRFSFQVEIDADIELDWIKIPPMLVQPFVENAVLHGIEPLHDRQGKVTVEYRLLQEQLQVTVTDNGPGITATQRLKADSPAKYAHKSLGMTITQRRLQLLNHADYDMSIEEPTDEHGRVMGTHVMIVIPVDH